MENLSKSVNELNNMITIISGTNHKESVCEEICLRLRDIFPKYTDEEVKFLNLKNLPLDILNADMYSKEGQSKEIAHLQDTYIKPAQKLFIVSPEYNGSFPGVLKTFIDACSVRDYIGTFSGKKAALVGISSGRAGNLRGMEHLTGILNFLGITVMPNKLPISKIETLIDENKQINDPYTLDVLEKQVKDFVVF